MPTIRVQVRGKVATNLTPEEKLVCGNEDYEVEFDFDESWAGVNFKTGLFIRNGELMAQPFDGNICAVPRIENTTLLAVGVKSSDGRVFTTTPAFVDCLKSASDLATNKIPAPTKDVYDEIIALINKYIGQGGGGSGGTDEERVREIVAEETADLVAKDERDEFVKGGLTESEETWTDEDKAKACETIGAVAKQTKGLILYGTDANGNQTAWSLRNTNNTKNTIAGRDSNGNIQVGTAVNPTDCVNLQMLDDKTDALSQDISVINIALEQSGLLKKYKQPIEQEYNERVTADGANVLDGSKAILKKVVGNTVKCKQLFNISQKVAPTTGLIYQGNAILVKPYNVNVGTGKDYFPFLEVGKTYTFIVNSINGGIAKFASPSKDYAHFVVSGVGYKKKAVTITQEMLDNNVYFYGSNGEGYWEYQDFMVVEGDYTNTEIAFQPVFTGLKSASFAGIESGGKNILNQALLNGGEFVIFNGKSCYKYVDKTGAGFSFKAGFIKNQRYTITAKIYREENQVGNAVYLRVWYTDGTKQEVYFTPNALKSFTTTANKTVDYIDSLPNYSQNAYLDLTVTQIEAGTVATEFSAYVEATFDFPKTETPLGTTIDFETKKITDYGVELVLTGTENWGYYNGLSSNGVSLGATGKPVQDNASGVCTDAEISPSNKAYAIRFLAGGLFWFGILDRLGFTTAGATPTEEEKATAIANFKAWLAQRYADGNPVTIRYISSTLQSEADFTADNEYTAYKGGTEKVLENDGNEYGADNTLTQDYILVTEVK